MKYTLIFIAFIFTGFNAKAQCGDLFFSEYIEGSGYNKALEIYNPSGADIDLSDYQISLAFNGSDEAAGTFVLSGTVAAGDVYVISHPSADGAITSEADLITSLLFNGDDAVWLEKISTGDTLDIIGIIGNDPGSYWTVTDGTTRDHTIVRDMSVQQGTTDWDIASAEWNGHPTNTFSFIGDHTMTPCEEEPCTPTTSTIDETACDVYTVPSGDEVYSESGTYYDTIPNAVGCDSIITINLTVNFSTENIITETVCDTYTVPSGDEIYTESGTYYDTIPNAVGCDSLITINLVVNHSTESSIEVTACDNYTVPSGDETYTESGTYYDTIPNAAGCDSLITLNLTINNSSTGIIDITVCESYTVPSGDETYTETGMYIDTIPNAVGCDSIITIYLTVTEVNVATSTSETGETITADATDATYQWINCDDNTIIEGETSKSFTAESNGNYAVIVTQDECSDTSECVTVSTVGIDENINIAYQLFPNPTSGKFTINGLNSNTETTVNIVEIASAKLVYTAVYQGKESILINENLPAGAYIVMLSNGNSISQVRLIVQ